MSHFMRFTMTRTSTGLSAALFVLLSATQLAVMPVADAQSAPLSAASATKVPIMQLAPSDAKAIGTFGAILGLRQLPNGSVLVNDAGRRRLVMLDSKLANETVVIDSAAGAANSYGLRPAPLINYLGDSSLFVDAASSSLLVIDPLGAVSRVMSAPKPGDLRFLGSSSAYVDNKGRLLYRGAQVITQNRNLNPGERPAPIQPPDSAPILRADFDTREVDTVGRVKISSGTRVAMDRTADGKMQVKMTINPVQVVDDWAVLSDGTLAFVRGHDYHVEATTPTGESVRGAKLPFDWKRLEDSDKQTLIDSARTAQESAQRANAANTTTSGAVSISGGSGAVAGGGGERVMVVMSAGGGGSVGGGGGSFTSGDMGPGQEIKMGAPQIEFVPLKEIADYYPSIRSGAAKPDLDGNLWILTTTSAQSQGGELVYDVVNKKGELFQRVRIPKGRSVAGFGRGGVVFLMSGDRTNGFQLERTSILGGGRATP